SSLRNTVHRRDHKERGQLVNRSRLALLEKKRPTCPRLPLPKKNARKDEFYFSMIKAKTLRIRLESHILLCSDLTRLKRLRK
ncbi:hypothetical protein BS47DRAFT_1302148, partial [Hydnum rufescens UP504]